MNPRSVSEEKKRIFGLFFFCCVFRRELWVWLAAGCPWRRCSSACAFNLFVERRPCVSFVGFVDQLESECCERCQLVRESGEVILLFHPCFSGRVFVHPCFGCVSFRAEFCWEEKRYAFFSPSFLFGSWRSCLDVTFRHCRLKFVDCSFISEDYSLLLVIVFVS